MTKGCDIVPGPGRGDVVVGSLPISALSIPANPAAVTTEWLTEVLHRAGSLPDESSVAQIAIEPLGAGVGVMGELARNRLNYSGDQGAAPATVIVKSPSPFEENRAAMQW